MRLPLTRRCRGMGTSPPHLSLVSALPQLMYDIWCGGYALCPSTANILINIVAPRLFLLSTYSLFVTSFESDELGCSTIPQSLAKELAVADPVMVSQCVIMKTLATCSPSQTQPSVI